ncbi:MAG: TSUP family transporter [Novosphingobium sp.]
MELVLVAIVALAAAALTLFSGFGLGTILMPIFALFFPVPVAIAATAVVHLANNIFKLGLMARQADWYTVLRFGLPASLAAMAGAMLLGWIDTIPVVATWSLGGHHFEITLVKAAIGVLIATFALLELWPRLQSLAFPPRWLPLGGLLSGLFGGLSGNQGALRSAFLIKAGLSKEAFVATGAVAAVMVDAVRIGVYGSGTIATYLEQSRALAIPVLTATLFAFLGSYFGKMLLTKVTLRSIQLTVAGAMVIIGAGLALGLV